MILLHSVSFKFLRFMNNRCNIEGRMSQIQDKNYVEGCDVQWQPSMQPVTSKLSPWIHFRFSRELWTARKLITPAQCIQWAHLCCHSFRCIADLGRGSVPHARSGPRTHTWMDLVFCTRVPWKHSCPVGFRLRSVVWIVAVSASSGVGSCDRVSTEIQASRLQLLYSCGNTSHKT